MAGELSTISCSEVIQLKTVVKWTFTVGKSLWKKESPVFQLINRPCTLHMQVHKVQVATVEGVTFPITLGLEFKDKNPKSDSKCLTLHMHIIHFNNKHIYSLYKFILPTKGEQVLSYTGSINYVSQLLAPDQSAESAIELVFDIFQIDSNLSLNLIKDLSCLLKNKKDTDFAIMTTDGKTVQVHKTILLCRSQVFEKTLNTDMVEKNSNMMKLPCDSNILMELLDYIYAGKFVTSKNPSELLKLAHYLEFQDLQYCCEESLMDMINMENFVDMFQLADKYDLVQLYSRVEHFFYTNENICVKDAQFQLYIKNNINIRNITLVLNVASLHRFEEALKLAMEFVRLHYKDILKNPHNRLFFSKNGDLLLRIFEHSLDAFQSQKKPKLSQK